MGGGGGVLYFGHPDIDARVSDVAYEPIAISFFFTPYSKLTT